MGTTLALELRTLPNLTAVNLVSEVLLSSLITSSANLFVAPITLVGFTALSVDIRRKVFCSDIYRTSGDGERAAHIVGDRLGWCVFHQVDVFMRGGVEDSVRVTLFHQAKQGWLVVHVHDADGQLCCRAG